MNALRIAAIAGVALAAPLASACSLYIPWFRYVNVVSLTGDRVPGLKWSRMYNILDYTGEDRLRVSVVRQGAKIPVVLWQDGQECTFEPSGNSAPEKMSCHTNLPRQGIRLESHFKDWREAADRAESLPRVWLPLIVEFGGRELRMTLRSQPVRNNRKLQSDRAARIANEACPDLE
ncbi:MAG: hypothetical protein K0Q92_771 [Steroidobacteraceae bacterium]|jgi:hypothetical protein|nr:hypothetical protein [Steroidobacteraceae bacterium]